MRRLLHPVVLPVLLGAAHVGGGCGGDGAASDVGPVEEGACGEVEARLGHRACVHRVPDRATWEAITFELAAVDADRTTSYLVPARDDARVPTVFVDASAFDMPEQSLHHKFLTESFPELALLSYPEYLELTQDPERREWFAGNVTELPMPGEPPLFGFSVWDAGSDPDATIDCQQFQRIRAELEPRFGPGELLAMPANDLQRDVLAECDLPFHDRSRALVYERYTGGRGCGTLRRYTLAELAEAEARAEIGWQDILVVDQAPLDVETIIAGILTGTRQGELSHLNVRSASRGTPNCYLMDAHAALEEWDGQLVELECGPDGVNVVSITPERAQECGDARKPEPVRLVEADRAWAQLVPLLELPTASAEERRAGVARFGSKGANLATLYQRIDPELQLRGFLIPLQHYDAFVKGQGWSVDLGGGEAMHSFEETLAAWLEDPSFLSDGALRRERLGALQRAMREAPCDAALIEQVGTHIVDSHGADDVMVRFRSSSNAEDALGFNGAGLYDSTSVCLADELDGDALGPSHCDPDQPQERGVCRGLQKVWASLWNMKAFEERAWYGIEHREVAMGILVNSRTKGERANIVAFSGNPLLRGDRRYLINAQLGELDVVSALAGVWPEKDLLTIEEGRVVAIERARGSTELPDGEWVLEDALLEQLGESLATIVEAYPVDEEVPATADVLLDTEWKLRSDGRLAIKQVRPFLD